MSVKPLEIIGGRTRTRTVDPLIKSESRSEPHQRLASQRRLNRAIESQDDLVQLQTLWG